MELLINDDLEMQGHPECAVCHGVGFICIECRHPEGECICDEEDGEMIACPECNLQ